MGVPSPVIKQSHFLFQSLIVPNKASCLLGKDFCELLRNGQKRQRRQSNFALRLRATQLCELLAADVIVVCLVLFTYLLKRHGQDFVEKQLELR